MKRQKWWTSAQRRERDDTILNMYFDGKSTKEISAYFGMAPPAVSTIINRENIDYVCNEDKVFVPCCNLDK
jgi:hypothetical protein